MAAKISATYDVPVAGVLPLSEDMVRLASGGVFCLDHPTHQVTDVLRQISTQLG